MMNREVISLEYIKVSEAAQKWGLSPRRVRVLCAENRIGGVIQKGKLYMIPADAEKPDDARATKSTKVVLKRTLSEIDQRMAELSRRRPLTAGEVQRLRDEFLVEYTYNSNAIEGNTLTLQETALVLEGVTIDQKPLKDHLEAIGHRDAFQYVEELVKDKTELSEYVVKCVHSLEMQRVVVHEAVESDDGHAGQIVPLSDFEVRRVVAGSDLERSCAEVEQDGFVSDDGNRAVGDGDADGLADDTCVARVSRVHGDGRISQDRLRARCRNRHEA